jgi:AraC-like DNA-binding protein
VRLNEAAHRVRAGHSVKNVAFDLGYKQLSHFSRDFKRAYGAPPSRVAPKRRRARARFSKSPLGKSRAEGH